MAEVYYTWRRDPALRHFAEDFRTILAGGTRGRALLDALRVPLECLLDSRGWLEASFLRPVPGDVAAWALYRSHDPDLCLFTMVVPPGMRTRVHNHLTDGWVALLQGGQVEHIYRRTDDGSRAGFAELELQVLKTFGGRVERHFVDEKANRLLTFPERYLAGFEIRREFH